MIYLYLDKNHVKLLSLSKAILSQYTASFFQKNHETDLLTDGKIVNVDLVASAIKEAITLASPKEIKEKDVFLILPQQGFEFKRYDVPFDISDSAVLPFVKDKVRSELPFELESSMYDYFVTKQGTESKVLFYAQGGDEYKKFQEAFKLLGLSLKTVIPDTLAYFKLFDKTLKKDKKEVIMYGNYETANEFGYLFDSFGLLKNERYEFKEPLEESIKAAVDGLEKESLKPNRLILGGPGSDTIRQDYFTKNVGVWTNPLKKIITTFYDEYIKLIVIDPNTAFSYMDYAVCVGSFIFAKENEDFSLEKRKPANGRSSSGKSFSFPKPSIHMRDIVLFLIAFALSFTVIYFFPTIKGLKAPQLSMTPPSPTAAPTKAPTATPTPSFTKDSLKIKILNGGGTPGKATDVKTILDKDGYGEILTGNADSFDFKTTEIQVKSDKKSAFQLVKDDLADYVSKPKESTLSSDDAADIVIIVGQDFK